MISFDIQKISEPEILFSKENLQSDFHSLCKKWHPDLNKDPSAGSIFQHILDLKKLADKKLADGQWEIPGVFEILLVNGKSIKYRYKKKFDFELGKTYISKENTLLFLIEKKYGSLFQNACHQLSSFQLFNDSMSIKYKNFIPIQFNIYESFPYWILLIKKDPATIRASDLLDLDLNPVHLTWITSRLMDFNCYLYAKQVSHNQMTLENIYVSPKNHTIALYGGWWYSANYGLRYYQLPTASVQFLPKDKIVSSRIDQYISNSELLRFKGLTPPMKEFLKTPPTSNPIQDLKYWYSKIVGERKFTEWNLTFDDVYGV